MFKTVRSWLPVMIAACLCFGISACKKQQVITSKRWITPAEHNGLKRSASPVVSNRLPSFASKRTGPIIQPMGSIPYDKNSLPVVSPDGRLIATQVGRPASRAVMLAESGGLLRNTRIEIYMISPHDSAPVQIGVVQQPVLLGRACDDTGFLVEAPQLDGSRWIGKVSWTSGRIDWVVTGSDVNAFATMGKNGRMAWSRRSVDEQHFELVIRNDAGVWSLPADGADWLMPVFSGVGDGLFVLSLNDGRLDLIHVDATNQQTILPSIRSVRLADKISRSAAVQTLAGKISILFDHLEIRSEELLFLHPTEKTMALWRPGSVDADPPLVLASNTFAGAISTSGQFLLSSGEHLRRFTSILDVTGEKITGGISIPRPCPAEPGGYILLSPDGSSMHLTGLKLPTDAAVTTQAPME